MVLYIIICLLSVLCGCGLLAALRVRLDPVSAIFLSPLVTLCALAILVGSLVAGGFTVGEITPALYVLLLGSSLFGAIRWGNIILNSWASLLALLAIPLVVMSPTILQGMQNYSGGLCLDGWAYVVTGQSLQNYPLGADGWLPLGTQFAAQFAKLRFISSGLLALLAPASGQHNDAQEVLGRYLGLLLFSYGSACLFFAKAVRLRPPWAWIFVTLTLISGWSLKLLNANSVDNTLALSFLPAAMGLVLFASTPSVRDGIVLGAILAAGLYAYPETWPFVVFGVLSIGVERAVRLRGELRNFCRMAGAAILTILVCVLPYAATVKFFFQRQLQAATGKGVRPGEGFYQLLADPRHILPGYWGLTPDFYLQVYSGAFDSLAVVMACFLTCLALAGLYLLLRGRSPGLPCFVLGMTAAYVVLLAHFNYSYGAFKVLVTTWFALCYLLIVAVDSLWQEMSNRVSTPLRYATAFGGWVFLAALAGFFILQASVFYRALPFKSVKEFSRVASLNNLARGQPVALLVNDTYANLWAVHFLRATKLYLAGQYKGYMANQRLLDRAEIVDPSTIRFIVTDSRESFPSSRLLSTAGPYFIWDQGKDSWILPFKEIDHLAGRHEDEEVAPPYWQNGSYVELRLISRTHVEAAADVEITAGDGLLDPAAHLIRVVGADSEEERSIRNGMHLFHLHLHPGLNRIFIGSAQKPDLPVTSSGISFSAEVRKDSPEIRDVESPNGVESPNSDTFFWVGTRPATVTVFAPKAGVVQLTTTLVAGPSLVDKSQAHLEIVSSNGAKFEKDLPWGSEQVPLQLQAGDNQIYLRATGQSVSSPADSRTMMVGFRNLRASYLNMAAN